MSPSAKKISTAKRLQPVYNIAEICAQKGIREAILCPGSRCAPLTLAFVRHPDITARTLSDERSAAFIAAGISLCHDTPAVLVCTSGSAVYHFAPAIAECFFQRIPLVALTADRPKEWIGQWDGQTIHQRGIYGKHVKKAYELPQDYDHPDALWSLNRMVNEAINTAFQEPKGPVHINVPLREPLYPKKDIHFVAATRIIAQKSVAVRMSQKEATTWRERLARHKKVLIVVGQHRPDDALHRLLERFAALWHIPVVADIASNQHGLSKGIIHAESILARGGKAVWKELCPDLLITLGKSILSKTVKQFLRFQKPLQHWHIQAYDEIADPYQGLTHRIDIHPSLFFERLAKKPPVQGTPSTQKTYCRRWRQEEGRVQQALDAFFTAPQDGELPFVHALINALPPTCNLHLSNSLPVRYAALIGLRAAQRGVRVFANRGVSGIDGCSSTAVGHALADNACTVLITGDMAFFHDRNAFWHNYPLPNLRIATLNNHGGAIFSTLPIDPKPPELDAYFVTRQPLNAKRLADEFGFTYLTVAHARETKDVLDFFFTFDGTTKIVEIESDNRAAKRMLDKVNLYIKKYHAS